MGHRLLAVLVPATADSPHHALATVLFPLILDEVIDSYTLGGQVTGVWPAHRHPPVRVPRSGPRT
ncbi:MAG TPA: hypothetical protein VF755_14490 [Catenuloplanes sp.]|jgi:hypothetical protein